LGESLNKLSIAVEQLALRLYPALPVNHVRREVGKAFADEVEDPDIKIQLLLERQKTATGALRQTLELQAVFLAAMFRKNEPQDFLGRPSPTETRDKL
jgi:hypothetical protein